QELEQVASNWRMAMAPLYERRVGPHKVALPDGLAPWSRWDPVLPGTHQLPVGNEFRWTDSDAGQMPARDEDIAFATVTQLAGWIKSRQLTSERLTNIYLARLEQYNP